MSGYSSNITDREIQELLRTYLLERDENDPLTQKLIDMEAKIVFANEPLIVPSLQKEQEFIKKLAYRPAVKAGVKWWLFKGLGLSVVAGLSVLLVKTALKQDAPESGPSFAAVPAAAHKAQDSAVAGSGVNRDLILPALNRAAAIQETAAAAVEAAEAREAQPEAVFPDFQPAPAPQPNYQPLVVADSKTSRKDLTSVDTLLSGIRKLEVEGLHCDIDVRAVPGNKVSLKGKVTVEARGLKTGNPDYKISYEVRDSVLKVWVENKTKTKIVVAGSISINGFLSFEVPAGTDAVLKNSSGNIAVEGLNGKICDLHSGYGNIKADNIGTGLNLRSRSGNIALNKISGNINAESSYGNNTFTDISGDMKIKSSSGEVSLNGIRGNTFITSSYGDITLKGLKGDVKAEASSGDITADGLEGKVCDLKSNYGDIRIQNVKADVILKSKSGDIFFTKVNGNINTESSYGVHNYNDITGNVMISSRSGDVSLSKVTGATDIVSDYGNVSVTDLKGDLAASVKSGDIRGKNIELTQKLKLNASYGDIRIGIANNINDLSFDLQSGSGRIRVEKNGKKFEGKDGKLFLEQGKILVTGYSSSGDQTYSDQ